MEQRIVATESALPFRALPAAALRGRGLLQLGRGIITMAAGVRAARHLIRELRPQAILGTGGYVCVPLFIAARLARVPTMIYLPDVVPGLAGRLLARIATLVAVNVVDALPVLGLRPGHPRSMVTGYPVRPELFQLDHEVCRTAFGLDDQLPVVLIYGGSRGARSLNQATMALLPDLLDRCQIIHVCGREGDEQPLRAAWSQLPAQLQMRYQLYPYLDGVHTPIMAAAFGAADLAICRSGASTMAELPAVGLPAILVPYPYVHQDENADYLVRHGAAVKVADRALLGSNLPREGALFQAVDQLLHDPAARQRMAAQSRAVARPDAAQQLAMAICSLATASTRSGC